MLPLFKMTLTICLIAYGAVETFCFRIALIYDARLDVIRPRSNIELWMSIAIEDAQRLCLTSASYEVFEFSNNTELLSELDQILKFDGLVVSVTECRTGDSVEAIVSPLGLPFLRLNFLPCPDTCCGLKTENLEPHRLNGFNSDTCGSFALTRWLEQHLCFPFMDNNTKRFLIENITLSASRELQDCAGLDDLQWSNFTYSVILNPSALSESVKWHQQLNGKHLRLASLERPPFVIFERDLNGSITACKGYCCELINALQETYNFTYEVVFPGDKTYGKETPNGGWGGMIGMILTQDVDIGLGPFSVTYSRYKVVDFTVGFHEETAAILIPPAGEDNRLLVFVKPFLWEVWVSLVLCVTILPAIIWKHVKLLQFSHGGKTHPDLTKQYFFVVGVLIGQSGQKIASFGFSPRMLGAVWCLSGVVFASAYVGVLFSILRYPKLTPIINKLEDLPVSNLKWVFPQGSALEALFLGETTGIYKTIGEGLSDARGSLADSGVDGVERVIQGSHAYIDEKSFLTPFIAEDYERSGMCRLSFAHEEFFKVSIAFPLPKDSYLKPLLDKKIMQIMEAGLGNYWKNKYWSPLGGKCGPNIHPTTGPRTLGISDLQGAFLILAIGCGLAVFVCLAEMYSASSFPHYFLCSSSKENGLDVQQEN